jgi:hypothetical protein
VTRDSFFRLDPQTMEVRRKYALTQLKRWAATRDTFTVDFGEVRVHSRGR